MEERKIKEPEKPAYPTNARMNTEHTGYTKRQDIARTVMPAIIIGSQAVQAGHVTVSPERVAELAYMYADALLKGG